MRHMKDTRLRNYCYVILWIAITMVVWFLMIANDMVFDVLGITSFANNILPIIVSIIITRWSLWKMDDVKYGDNETSVSESTSGENDSLKKGKEVSARKLYLFSIIILYIAMLLWPTRMSGFTSRLVLLWQVVFVQVVLILTYLKYK